MNERTRPLGSTYLPTVEPVAFIAALAQTWFVTGTGRLRVTAERPPDDQRLAQHRSAIAETVRRLVG